MGPRLRPSYWLFLIERDLRLKNAYKKPFWTYSQTGWIMHNVPGKMLNKKFWDKIAEWEWVFGAGEKKKHAKSWALIIVTTWGTGLRQSQNIFWLQNNRKDQLCSPDGFSELPGHKTFSDLSPTLFSKCTQKKRTCGVKFLCMTLIKVLIGLSATKWEKEPFIQQRF